MSYTLPSFVFIRVANLPWEDISKMYELSTSARREFLKKYLSDPQFLLGLKITYPRMHQELITTHVLTDKHYRFIEKVILRQTGRAVPFDLFSHVGFVKVKNEIQMNISDDRSIYLEKDWSVAAPEVKDSDSYFLNPTLVQVGNTASFIETKALKWQTLELPAGFWEIIHTLHNKTFSLKTLSKHLSKSDALNFVKTFKSLSLIIPENTISPLNKYETVFKTADLKAASVWCDKNASTHEVKSIHAVSVLEDKTLHLDQSVVKKILRGSEVMFLLTGHLESQTMYLNRGWKQKFREIYDEEEVPLLTLFDQLTGILNTQVHPRGDVVVHKNLVDDILNEEVVTHNEIPVIQIDNEFLERRSKELSTKKLANFTSKAQVSKSGKVQLDFVAGGPISRFLGRFSYLDEEFENNFQELIEIEKRTYPDHIIAEINHLTVPQMRMVSRRNIETEYRIDILAGPAQDSKNIPLNDIVVSLRNDSWILRSKSLNRFIIPIISNAVNLENETLPLIKFLGILRRDNGPEVSHWDWAHRARGSTPRVEFEGIILAPARWFIPKKVVKILMDKSTSVETFESLISKLRLPNWVQLGTIDNARIFCSRDPSSWRLNVKEANDLIAKEVCFTGEDLLVSSPKGHHLSELMVNFYSEESEKIHKDEPRPEILESIQTPSGTCLYFQISGSQAGLRLLLEKSIRPLIKKLNVTDWHFLFYGDPDLHLRLRFFCSKTSRSDVLKEVSKVLDREIRTGLLREYSLNTYRPENIKYLGKEGLRFFERISSIESEIALEFRENIFHANTTALGPWTTLYRPWFYLISLQFYFTYFKLDATGVSFDQEVNDNSYTNSMMKFLRHHTYTVSDGALEIEHPDFANFEELASRINKYRISRLKGLKLEAFDRFTTDQKINFVLQVFHLIINRNESNNLTEREMACLKAFLKIHDTLTRKRL